MNRFKVILDYAGVDFFGEDLPVEHDASGKDYEGKEISNRWDDWDDGGEDEWSDSDADESSGKSGEVPAWIKSDPLLRLSVYRELVNMKRSFISHRNIFLFFAFSAALVSGDLMISALFQAGLTFILLPLLLVSIPALLFGVAAYGCYRYETWGLIVGLVVSVLTLCSLSIIAVFLIISIIRAIVNTRRIRNKMRRKGILSGERNFREILSFIIVPGSLFGKHPVYDIPGDSRTEQLERSLLDRILILPRHKEAISELQSPAFRKAAHRSARIQTAIIVFFLLVFALFWGITMWFAFEYGKTAYIPFLVGLICFTFPMFFLSKLHKFYRIALNLVLVLAATSAIMTIYIILPHKGHSDFYIFTLIMTVVFILEYFFLKSTLAASEFLHKLKLKNSFQMLKNLSLISALVNTYFHYMEHPEEDGW